MPGKPRPAPKKTGVRPDPPAAGSSWFVVAGVSTFAGSPLVGADDG
jgi:hypothetical protein